MYRVYVMNSVLAALFFCFTVPAVALPANIIERDVKVGTGQWAVDGTLTTPSSKGPHPAVLLVPGSGLADRDMTVGKNKIFRDVAGAFAQRGIVTLRIEKRLVQHMEKFRSQQVKPSVRTEFLDDSVEAVKLLRSMPEVDPKQIYVLGHSQGATFAPRIANLAGDVAGVIIIAGSTRKPGEMIEEQVAHTLSQPNISEEDRKQAQGAMEGAKQLRKLPVDDDHFVLGMPASYWHYFYEYDAAAEAARLPGRVLVIQNGRDYQVTEQDFAGWKKALESRPNVTLKVYPKLNHLMQEGKGVSTSAEYEKLGGPSPRLLSDIADWMLKRKS